MDQETDAFTDGFQGTPSFVEATNQMFESSRSAEPPRMAPKPTTTTVSGVFRMISVGPVQISDGMLSAATRVALAEDALHAAVYARKQRNEYVSSFAIINGLKAHQ